MRGRPSTPTGRDAVRNGAAVRWPLRLPASLAARVEAERARTGETRAALLLRIIAERYGDEPPAP